MVTKEVTKLCMQSARQKTTTKIWAAVFVSEANVAKGVNSRNPDIWIEKKFCKKQKTKRKQAERWFSGGTGGHNRVQPKRSQSRIQIADKQTEKETKSGANVESVVEEQHLNEAGSYLWLLVATTERKVPLR